MKILIWDSPLPCEINKDYDILIQWQISNDLKNSISIPLIVENNDIKFRNLLLLYIYDLGEIKINNKSVSEYLYTNQIISYWWMTLITEKRNFDISINLKHILYLLAFDDYISKFEVTQLTLFSKNEKLQQVLQKYSYTKGIDFINFDKKNIRKFKFIQIVFLSKILKALIWFTYFILSKFVLFGQNVYLWKKNKSFFLFFSYFNNIDITELRNNKLFRSHYWGNLPEEIRKNKTNSKWIHIWTKSKEVSNVFKYRKYLNTLNKNSENEIHIALESFLTLNILFKTFNYWFKIIRKSFFVKKEISNFKFFNYEFWPLIEDDFYESFFGKTAIKNILNLHLIENAFANTSKVQLGCYLQENQIWELSLISVFKKFSIGKLVGYPNTIIRFWDLRYFHHYKLYYYDFKYKLPQPDFIAINGLYNKEMLLNADFPSNRLIEVESLRYQYLNNINESRKTKYLSKKEFKILLLGDYLYENTNDMFSILKSSKLILLSKYKIEFKPHPSCNFLVKNVIKNKNINITNKHLSELLQSADVVVTSSLTSASLDCYLNGSKLITIKAISELNLNPLRKIVGVCFVTNSQEFDNALDYHGTINNYNQINISDFFFLDFDLNKWKKLLY